MTTRAPFHKPILVFLCLLWLKPVLFHDGFALWRDDESGKGTCGLLFVCTLHDCKPLIDWLVQLFRYERPTAIALNTQRQRYYRNLDIARLRVLQRLSNVVAVN